MRPSVASPTGTVIGPPVSITSAPREAVGRVHRDRAHAVVAEVLLDLADEQLLPAAMPRPPRRPRPRARDRDRVVDLGQPSGKTASITTPWISSMRRPTLRFSVFLRLQP